MGEQRRLCGGGWDCWCVNQPMSSSIQKIKDAVMSGANPAGLSISLAIGIVIGLFPVYGVTTFMATGLFAVLEMLFPGTINGPCMIAINVMMAPLEIMLFIPMARLGLVMCQSIQVVGPNTELYLPTEFTTDNMMEIVGKGGIYAIFAWSVLAVPVTIVLIVVLKPLLVLMTKLGKSKATPSPVSPTAFTPVKNLKAQEEMLEEDGRKRAADPNDRRYSLRSRTPKKKM